MLTQSPPLREMRARPNGVPAYYQGRPAAFWITIMSRQTRRAAAGHAATTRPSVPIPRPRRPQAGATVPPAPRLSAAHWHRPPQAARLRATGKEAAMGKQIFEAFSGQPERYGYSQAVRAGDTIYVAGTLGVGDNLDLPDDMATQMELAYRNVAQTLAHFGAGMSHVVDQKVYVTDLDAAMAQAGIGTAAYGRTGLPASTMVQVQRLALPGAKVEISVVARMQPR